MIGRSRQNWLAADNTYSFGRRKRYNRCNNLRPPPTPSEARHYGYTPTISLNDGKVHSEKEKTNSVFFLLLFFLIIYLSIS